MATFFFNGYIASIVMKIREKKLTEIKVIFAFKLRPPFIYYKGSSGITFKSVINSFLSY